jgi:glycosyltransferase involved in cell wall biosynthesis
MIKVAHIAEGFVGGICTHLCTVLPGLARKGFDVTLIVSLGRFMPDANVYLDELRRRGVAIHVIPMRRGIHPLADARALITLAWLLARQRFDIVHTHGSKAGALGRMAAALVGRPVRLHSPHCFAFLRNGRCFTRFAYLELERLLGRLTSELIAVAPSEAWIATQRRIVPPARCRIVPNALPDGQAPAGGPTAGTQGPMDPPAGLRPHHIVTTVCRLVDYKGIFRFLRAAQLSQTPDTRFRLVGDGELEAAARRFIAAHHLEHKVELLGYVRDMESVYARSDLIVLCSDAEAMPYCLLEAMRARCAIVATAVIGNRDLLVHNQTGLLVEPEPAGIARAIDDLLSRPAKRVELADNAYTYFRKHHALEKQIARLSDIYRSLCNGGEPCTRHEP